MNNSGFQFKQFKISHDKASMKVGADGVTLGAWANIYRSEKILDIGCGSGLISLMAAQRSHAEITAIDIDLPSVEQTMENAAFSPWSKRIKVIHQSVQSFADNSEEHFDHILSNPPFFVNSLKNPTLQRTAARHTDTLPFESLIEAVNKLLIDNGRFSLILPSDVADSFVQSAAASGLNCSRFCTLYPNTDRPAKRILLELKKGNTNCTHETLTIEQERGVYTREYYELVKEFYLRAQKAP